MKLPMIYKKLLPVFVLLLATAAFAANKASSTISQSVTVGGHQLAPGDYQFQWDGSGPSVNLNILSKGRLVTTAPARVVEQSSAPTWTTMKMRVNGDGTRTLSQIQFSGKKYALVFGDDAASLESSVPNNGKVAESKP